MRSTMVVVLALVACRARGTAAEAGADSTAPMPMGTVHVASVTGEMAVLLPDGSVELTQRCYEHGLVKNPNQRGELAITLTPPPKEGPVALSLAASGTLDASVVDCVRSVFGRYHAWSGGTRMQKTSATLELTPIAKVVPAPPSDRALRRVLESRYRKSRSVVRLVSLDVTDATQAQHGSGLTRIFSCKAEVEFVRAGYEIRCQGERGPFKNFSETWNPDVEIFPCSPTPRHPGERVTDETDVSMDLVAGKGWAPDERSEPRLYCGDAECP